MRCYGRGEKLNREKTVSVIIPVVRDYRIYKAIESLKDQDCEIIIIQSGEEEWKELKEFCEKNKVKFYYLKNATAPQAYNFGASIAKGDILVCGDSDTIFSKNFISDVKKYTKKGWITAGGWITLDFGEKLVIGDQAWFLYKSDYEKIGGYDESFTRYAYDVAFCLKAKRKGIKCRRIPQAIYYHPSTAQKRGFNVGREEAKANKKYGYQKTWRMIAWDVLEIWRIIRHMVGLIIGSII